MKLPTITHAIVALGIFLSPNAASAANLKPETVTAWETYVHGASVHMQNRLSSDHPFLVSDEIPGQAAKLRNGEILVAPISASIPKRVPSGLIHDWIGATFIPNATVTEVLSVIRDYGRYRDIYRPAVIDSRAFTSGETEDRFSVVLMNRTLFAKTALDSNYKSTFSQVDDHRWYSIAETMGIQEIAGYGTTGQHILPKDEGTGLIWRMSSIARFEERDGGVYVEVEAIVLSRDVPVSLRWLVDPIIRRVSRESLQTSMQQTQDAVRSNLTGLSSSMAPSKPNPSGVRSFR
ncbi:MAG: hypothetical protein JWO48_935 [Bryobacterales bacterium]|nr:hypothetical protein [Bryobacterales bacterium]